MSRAGRRLAGVVLVGVVVVAALALDVPPSEEDLTTAFREAGAWAYAIGGGLAFVEVGTPLGLVAPTELAVPFAGAAAAAGSAELVPLVAVVWLCAALGESVSFLAGRRLGRGVVDRHGPRVGITAPRVARVERHFARHGRLTVVLARFGPYVRTLTPFLAGAAHMPYARFLPASLAGTGVWAAALCVLGYVLFDSLGLADEIVTGVGVAVVATAVLVVVTRLRRRARR